MKFNNMAIHTTVFISILIALGSCNGQNQKSTENTSDQPVSIIIGDTVASLGKNIDCIFQDKRGNYWLASNGDGVYRYDGKTLTHITAKDGLCSNFVWTIQEDTHGHIWFSTRDGVCRFNGISFTNYTDMMNIAPRAKLKYTKGGLFFDRLNGVCFYDGKSFTGFSIHPASYGDSPSNMNRPYSVYSTLVDKNGNVWFGTQEKGVCRYDGISFAYFTDHGLDKAAVRTLFQDRTGNIWAGNNGAGLFKFNGNGFTNFTDERGVANRTFLKTLQGKDGTLARPWTINEDDTGNLWIGTIDAGVWKYDGKDLTNYTTKDGLAGNSIWTIFKDKSGELWYVTDGEEICTFNGRTFDKYTINEPRQEYK